MCYGRLRGGLLTEGHPRLGRHRPSPDLCGGLPAALLQPPRDSQRAKRHNAMPCVSVSQGFSQHRYQNPDSSPQPPGLHSSPRPLLPLLPFYFAMSPALSWDLHTCLSLIRENPCLNPCHSQHPLITQILAYLSPPQKGLHFASAISIACASLSPSCAPVLFPSRHLSLSELLTLPDISILIHIASIPVLVSHCCITNYPEAQWLKIVMTDCYS